VKDLPSKTQVLTPPPHVLFSDGLPTISNIPLSPIFVVSSDNTPQSMRASLGTVFDSSGSIPSLSSPSFDIREQTVLENLLDASQKVVDIGVVFTNTSPIVTITGTNRDIAKQVVDPPPAVDASILPPWLSAYTPKRKMYVCVWYV